MPVTRTNANVRGQAIVESVLGILVFISVAMWGIHFAEVTFTSMKVTEAAQSAVWDSTSGQMHVLPPGFNFSGASANVTAAAGNANGRYADFDGRTAATPSATPKGIFSSAAPGSMSIQCRTGNGFDQSAGHVALLIHELLVYRDNGGMRCNAEAFVDPMGTMKVGAFLEGANGFFGKSQNAARAQRTGSVTQTAGYKVCAVNRPNGINGNCRGSFEMLIDDWGMASGGNEEDSCPALPYGFPCLGLNINFWTSAYLMYTLNSFVFQTQDRSEYQMASLVAQPPVWAWPGIPMVPGNPTSFYLSWVGEDALFLQPVWPGDGSLPVWFTTPYGLFFPTYTAAHVSAGDCYLGKNPCNAGTITDP